MSETDWGLTKHRRVLPPFLALIEAHNAAYNRRVLLGRLIAVLLGAVARRYRSVSSATARTSMA
jgi:hypothetical protein